MDPNSADEIAVSFSVYINYSRYCLLVFKLFVIRSVYCGAITVELGKQSNWRLSHLQLRLSESVMKGCFRFYTYT
jgi:hypothetical protein